MTVKTITITENAYNALKQLKHSDESFSEVILRTTLKKATAEDWLGLFPGTSEEAEKQRKAARNLRVKISKQIRERVKHVSG